MGFVLWLSVHVRKDFDRGTLRVVPSKSGDGNDRQDEGTKDGQEDTNETSHVETSARTGWGLSSGS